MPSGSQVKHAIQQAKGATVVLGFSLLSLIFAIYEQMAHQFQYTTAYGGQTTYAAGPFHALCIQQLNNGINTVDPVTTSNACAQAATDETAKGNFVWVAIVLAMIGGYWMHRRLTRKPEQEAPTDAS